MQASSGENSEENHPDNGVAQNLLQRPPKNGKATSVLFTLYEEQEQPPRSSTDQNCSGMRQANSALSVVSLGMVSLHRATSVTAIESLFGLLSALYALLLIIFSVIFELSAVLHVRRYDRIPWIYESFHIYLYGTALLFFAYCHGFYLHRGWLRTVRRSENSLRSRLSRSRIVTEDCDSVEGKSSNNPKKVSLACASHGGVTSSSLFLRMGCIVFGIVSIVSIGMDLFQCIESYAHDSSTKTCDKMRIVKLWLGAAFTFIQMHFIFQNSKMTIHRSKNLAKFGTMHLVAVNVWAWLRHLILEEYEASREIDSVHTVKRQTALWNSRTLENATAVVNATQDRNQLSYEEKAGFLYLVTSCSNPQNCVMRDSFVPIVYTCMIEYSLIAAGVMFVVWWNIGLPPLAQYKTRKQHLRVDCSSSTSGLFVGLVFLVATFVSLIVFFSKLQDGRDDDALWVFSLTDAALYLVSMGACILGIQQTSKLSYVSDRHSTGAQLLGDILLIVGLIGQLLFCVSGIVGLVSSHHEQVPNALISLLAAHIMRLVQVLLQTVFILSASRMVATTNHLQRTKPGREVVTFLMVVNLALFLVNTFEGQKASINHAVVDFYGEEAWAFVVQCTLPLSIFYRFHSSVCLAEIWKHSYRVRVRSYNT